MTIAGSTIINPSNIIPVTAAPAEVKKNSSYELNGSSYIFPLPALGDVGSRIELLGSSSSTVIIDANGSDTIEGAPTYAMTDGDYLLLQDDGLVWRIVARYGLSIVAGDSNAVLALTADVTKVAFEDNTIDTHNQVNSFNLFTSRRAGVFRTEFCVATTPATIGNAGAYFNGSKVTDGVSSIAVADAQSMGFITQRFAIGDTMEIRYDLSESTNTDPLKNWWRITECV